MKTLKQLKWSIIILAVAYIVLGVVLIMFPSQTQRALSYILAISLIIVGIVNLIQYVKMDAVMVVDRYDLVFGFSGIIGGILIMINVDKFSQLILIVLGFMVTISGILKFQSSVNLLRLKSSSWPLPFALAIFNIVYGVIMLIDPFGLEVLFTLLGIGFIFSGITDIIVTIMVSLHVMKVTAAAPPAAPQAAPQTAPPTGGPTA